LLRRRVGTEAYAPPEIFFPGSEGYDATKYDVWSLGIILFLMLCIDALDIIQIPEMSTGAKRTTLRMPFLSYASVVYPLRENATGTCGNLTNQLDDPPLSFTGLLDQPAPQHERFWRHFPVRAARARVLARVRAERLRQGADAPRCARHPARRRRSGCPRPPRT
jgi:serine/threonine protein kinase